ncbi:MAG: peptide ABC transporter substrate-binding protein [Thermomicrobiales bacterium]|jgi:peptide/nickel transport system substrate-binding protein|nr:peptide ABC transporter substrate-binding protein [Thermomicrobiales bacterium]
MVPKGPFWGVYQQLKAGEITRREFIARATALGVGLPVTLFVLNTVKLDSAAAQDEPSTSIRPEIGTESQTRGEGGELRILQHQAPSIAFAHKGTGTKDLLAASLVAEPLISFAPDGTMIPTLASEVPTIENGGLSEDLLTATINLKEGVLWSDGEPFTADDVVFTWQWVLDPANASTSRAVWEPVTSVEALSPTQVKYTFAVPSIVWYAPVAGAGFGTIIPKHAWEGQDAEAVTNAFLTNPIGTGPYVVESFKENDQVIYVANENYREPNKPYFATVNLKGGGDADSAAIAVLQTGDWDFAWNLQVGQDILDQYQESGGQGRVYGTPPTNTERVMFNFSDPNVEVDGERSSLQVPNPRLSDKAVREALALAIDRETVAEQFYMGAPDEPPGQNWVTGLAGLESPNTSWEFNIDKANQILDEAGWALDGDVRSKDGVELKLTFYTSTNPVRQKTQAVIKNGWEQIGVKVQLGQVDASVFFASAPGNDQTYFKNYRDVQMYTNNPQSPLPVAYMLDAYAGEDNYNVSQKFNQWSGANNQRYINPEYDALYDELIATTDPERAAELFIGMNDIVINEFVMVQIVSRAGEKYGISNRLLNDNVAASDWEPLYWNVANWRTVPE